MPLTTCDLAALWINLAIIKSSHLIYKHVLGCVEIEIVLLGQYFFFEDHYQTPTLKYKIGQELRGSISIRTVKIWIGQLLIFILYFCKCCVIFVLLCIRMSLYIKCEHISLKK